MSRGERIRTPRDGVPAIAPVPAPSKRTPPTWERAAKWAAGILLGGAGAIVTATVTIHARPTRAEVEERIAPIEAKTEKCEGRIGGLEKDMAEVIATQRWEVRAIEAMLTHDGIYAVPPPPVAGD